MGGYLLVVPSNNNHKVRYLGTRTYGTLFVIIAIHWAGSGATGGGEFRDEKKVQYLPQHGPFGCSLPQLPSRL